MTNENQNRIERIDSVVTTAQNQINRARKAGINKRSLPITDARDKKQLQIASLRDLLLRIHSDATLTEFLESVWDHSDVKHERYDVLYEQNPANIEGWYLGWQPRDGKVGFDYAQVCLHSSTFAYDVLQIPFVLKNDRFVTEDRDRIRGKDIADLFPNLTAEILENGIMRAIVDAETYKLKRIKGD